MSKMLANTPRARMLVVLCKSKEQFTSRMLVVLYSTSKMLVVLYKKLFASKDTRVTMGC